MKNVPRSIVGILDQNPAPLLKAAHEIRTICENIGCRMCPLRIDKEKSCPFVDINGHQSPPADWTLQEYQKGEYGHRKAIFGPNHGKGETYE